MPSVLVDSIVSRRNRLPYVRLSIGKETVQLTVAEARKIASDLVLLASRGEADAMLFGFFDKMKFPEESAARLMTDFREFRSALDRFTVEGFESDPEGG